MNEERFFLPSARRPKPGRPRKYPRVDDMAHRPAPDRPTNGHTTGTVAVQPPEKKVEQGSALVWQAIAQVLPRLLNIDASAQYLGVSTWTIRALVDNGTLRPVRIPMDNGKGLRKLVFDRLDLDDIVSQWKEQGK